MMTPTVRHAPTRRRSSVVLALAILGAACSGEHRTEGVAGSAPNRHVLATLDVPEATVTFALADSVDLRPTLLRVGAGQALWLVDQWTHRVALMDGRVGTLRWVTGRQGGGPQEFRDIRDATPLGDSALAVLDAGLGRISVLDWHGDATEHVPVRAPGNLQQLVVLNDTSFVLYIQGAQAETPLVQISREGRVVGTPRVPWSGYYDIVPMAAQLALAGDGDRWVAAMLTGPRFFRFSRQDALHGTDTFVEAVDPPPVTTRTTGDRTVTRLDMRYRAASRVVTGDGAVLVLFEGAGELAGRLLDVYQMDDGSYLGSLVLSENPSDIQYADGRLFCFYQTPSPRVATFRIGDILIAAAGAPAGSGNGGYP